MFLHVNLATIPVISVEPKTILSHKNTFTKEMNIVMQNITVQTVRRRHHVELVQQPVPVANNIIESSLTYSMQSTLGQSEVTLNY